jgi:hypothetical protein
MGNDHADLKHLTVKRDRLGHELALLRAELSGLDQKIRAATREQSSIDAQIRKLKESTKVRPVIVSEHAILRYLERVKGIDLDQVKKEIAPEHILGRIRAMGAGEYPVGGTHTLKVTDSTIVTVLTKEEKPIPKPVVQEPEAPPLVLPPKPSGDLKCLKCEDLTDRLLNGGLCVLCVQEGFSLE